MNILEEVGSGKFFDNLLDFQNDDVEDGPFGSSEFDFDAFPPVWLEEESPALSSAGRDSNRSNGLSAAHRTVRYEDIIQFEWLSNFAQDSLSKVKTFPIGHAKRTRSKRPRPATFSPRTPIQLIRPLKQSHHNSGRQTHDQNKDPNANFLTYCTHCQTTETPRWREGPNGPGTLCNQCGLRYRSGRLCPEYRPVKKKKKKGSSALCGGTDRQSHNQNEDPNANSSRKCKHCQITENPQWSVDMYGLKTISNRCEFCNKTDQLASRPTFNPCEDIQLMHDKPKKKRKIKTQPLLSDKRKDPKANQLMKCSHCEITHSLIWRTGPKGRRTLCNACGLRYNSGRLFPEYRPVASPTFVPSLHSNTHRTVIQIRNSKSNDETTSCQPELLPYVIFDKKGLEQQSASIATSSNVPELTSDAASGSKWPEMRNSTSTMDEPEWTEVVISFHPELPRRSDLVPGQVLT